MLRIVFALLLSGLAGGTSVASADTPVRFSILKTGNSKIPRALAYQGGSFTRSTILTYSAFLIQRGDQYILIDTGLGTRARSQFKADMPLHLKPVIQVKNLNPVVRQLPEEILEKIQTIYVTHSHWDHISGLRDFPQACAALAPEEVRELKHAWPSQTKNVNWCPWEWSDQEYLGFKKSFDVFGDQSVVIVPLPGHTDGSVGILLQTHRDRYFLVGDLNWNQKALMNGKQVPRVMRWLLGIDGKRNRKTISQVRRLHRDDPEMKIIPSHDTQVLKKLGHYPHWIE